MDGAKAAAVGGPPEKECPDMNLRGEGKMPSRLPSGRRRYSMPCQKRGGLTRASAID